MPGSLPDCVVLRGGIAYIFFKETVIQRQSSTVSLRGKTKYTKGAEGRRCGPSDPYPIGATT